jgi:hypothetical protein
LFEDPDLAEILGSQVPLADEEEESSTTPELHFAAFLFVNLKKQPSLEEFFVSLFVSEALEGAAIGEEEVADTLIPVLQGIRLNVVRRDRNSN